MTKIHEFDPVIYPCKLFVVLNPTIEDLSGKFYSLTDEMERLKFDNDTIGRDRFIVASTFPVADKKTGWIGSLVCIYKNNKLDVRTICHESVHCADFFAENFGIPTGEFNNGEPYAYLTGWIADCIWKVKSGRIK